MSTVISKIVLIKKHYTWDDFKELVSVLKAKYGIYNVYTSEVTEWSKAESKLVNTGWRKMTITGTSYTVNRVLVNYSAWFESDPNADHDHAKCVESARAMGVPASYAHTPETYLSM